MRGSRANSLVIVAPAGEHDPGRGESPAGGVQQDAGDGDVGAQGDAGKNKDGPDCFFRVFPPPGPADPPVALLQLLRAPQPGALRDDPAEQGHVLLDRSRVEAVRERLDPPQQLGLSGRQDTCQRAAQLLAAGRGHGPRVGDQGMSQRRAARALCAAGIEATARRTTRAAFSRVAVQVLDDLVDGDRVMLGMPAVVVGDHGHGHVADLGLARQPGFLQVGHADDVHAPGAVEVGFGLGGSGRSLDET